MNNSYATICISTREHSVIFFWETQRPFPLLNFSKGESACLQVSRGNHLAPEFSLLSAKSIIKTCLMSTLSRNMIKNKSNEVGMLTVAVALVQRKRRG